MSGSQRLTVAYLRVNGDDVRLKYADLVAVRRDNGDLDWELVAYGLDEDEQFEPGPYHIDADVLEGFSGDERKPGSKIAGDSILVRSLNGAHVFRGVGDLEGLPDADP